MRTDSLVYCLVIPFLLISIFLMEEVVSNQLSDVQDNNSRCEIVLSHLNTEQKNYTIELRGLPEEVISQLASLSLSIKEWNEILAVYVGSEPSQDLPPVLGKYKFQSGSIVFQPQFSLDEGKTYTAVFNPNSVVKKYPLFQAGNTPLQKIINIPYRVEHEQTTVTKVYPTSNELPENLLRMYIYFSQPMSKGGVYQYLQLLDENGKEVELPFLELDEELWDPMQQRFTLLFDPGRIKKELKPNLDSGLPLVAGHSYTFVIKKEWKDANGHSMQDDFYKEFNVIPSDTKTPNPKDWKLTPPKKDTKDQLIIQFDEPLNHAMAERLIVIKDYEQNILDGSVIITNHETEFQFFPVQSWEGNEYSVHIDPAIEDRAGNSIMRAFDRDLSKSLQPHYTETIILLFSAK